MNNEIRILLLDDDELVRESISAFLEDEGFVVDPASTAEEALEMLGTLQHDVCITDYTLPGMDGERLILLAHEISPHTRFIMHSGATFTLSDELLQTGFTMNDVMTKPIMRLELLTNKIMTIVGHRGVSE